MPGYPWLTGMIRVDTPTASERRYPLSPPPDLNLHAAPIWAAEAANFRDRSSRRGFLVQILAPSVHAHNRIPVRHRDAYDETIGRRAFGVRRGVSYFGRKDCRDCRIPKERRAWEDAAMDGRRLPQNRQNQFAASPANAELMSGRDQRIKWVCQIRSIDLFSAFCQHLSWFNFA